MLQICRTYEFLNGNERAEIVFDLIDLEEGEDGEWAVTIRERTGEYVNSVRLTGCQDSFAAVESGCTILRGWIARFFRAYGSSGISLNGEGVDSWM
ncbi:hypothetical protein EON81_22780 [bacterium]|nr:MAG: hypothetical protein EON81_22780 [bacterium]